MAKAFLGLAETPEGIEAARGGDPGAAFGLGKVGLETAMAFLMSARSTARRERRAVS
jgi:hypothetical protein